MLMWVSLIGFVTQLLILYKFNTYCICFLLETVLIQMFLDAISYWKHNDALILLINVGLSKTLLLQNQEFGYLFNRFCN